MHACNTLPYDLSWVKALSHAPQLSGKELYLLDHDYGRLIADMALEFCRQYSAEPQLIAWHGHTIFHDPDRGATLQIGHGAELAAKLDKPVICQFRQLDMALGGQGAPLAPIADELLLPKADFYINLGGISNISFLEEGVRRSMDVCACNQILDKLAREVGLTFDAEGTLAAKGQVDHALLEQLNQWSFLQQPHPKSLDNTQVMTDLWPMVSKSTASHKDKLNTFCQHIALQLSITMERYRPATEHAIRIAITGGGAFNNYLMNCLTQALSDVRHTFVPLSRDIIAFKEAALMGLMGFLHVQGIANVRGSATGATADHLAGCIYPSWSSSTHHHE